VLDLVFGPWCDKEKTRCLRGLGFHVSKCGVTCFQFSIVMISCVPITCDRNMKSSNLNKCEGSGRKLDCVSFGQIFVFNLSGSSKS
jgi:hypothetical protein